MKNKEAIIADRFKSHCLAEQVIMYAEAIKREWYELLVIFDKCISQHNRSQFIAAVNLWLK